MKFSESWLREWVNPAVETTELVAQLTMAGLEVDAVEPVAPDFSGVVVGEIVSAEQHPNADKLRVCQVAGGESDKTQVVCGAPNARVGIKIPFATVGARLPGDFKIKKAKLRDVESFGMLCGSDEVGLGEASEGLWELPDDAPVGTDLREYLSLDDSIIEVDLTPNRGDCLSIRGLARETGVLNQAPVQEQCCAPVDPVIDDIFNVQLLAPHACSRYAGRIIRNVNMMAESPMWLQERLRRSGVRCIDPVVDVTNYVMIELGQPMHAFDFSKLEGGIIVRMAEQDEKLKLLDGSEVKLNADTLVIADQKKAVAMAGIMGGDETAVSSETRDIFLESAYFDPIAIAGRSRAYGMHTDSSHRFERGVDPKLQEVAIERATALLLDIVGGEAGPASAVEEKTHLPQQAEVTLTRARLQQQLGLSLDDAQVEEILNRLGLDVQLQPGSGWRCTAPSWRFDIAIEADLIEEVARIYGYNRLPTSTISAELPIEVAVETQRTLPPLRQQLIGRGYHEAITYCFVDPEVQTYLTPDAESVLLANPIASDMSVMRTTLWSGLLPAVRRNLNRQQPRVRLFETGLSFVPADGELKQRSMIAGAVTGSRTPESWVGQQEPVDFYDIKADVEALLQLSYVSDQFQFVAGKHPALHPGQCARIERNGELVGWLGQVHPKVQKALDLSQPVFVFEMHLDSVLKDKLPAFGGVSKFPEVRRDLALIVDEDISAGDLCYTVRQNAGVQLVDLKVFDVYQGKGIENNRKSVALGLTFRDSSRTLAEDEINMAVESVVTALEKQHAASLRG
jgi:phenylalanyl-tRNA synthetase beta chain